MWSKWWFDVVSLIVSSGSAHMVFDLMVVEGEATLQDCASNLLKVAEFHQR